MWNMKVKNKFGCWTAKITWWKTCFMDCFAVSFNRTRESKSRSIQHFKNKNNPLSVVHFVPSFPTLLFWFCYYTQLKWCCSILFFIEWSVLRKRSLVKSAFCSYNILLILEEIIFLHGCYWKLCIKFPGFIYNELITTFIISNRTVNFITHYL